MSSGISEDLELYKPQKKIPTDHKADGDNCLFWHSRLSFIGVKIKSFTVE